jgi:hypothetical protein
MILSDNETKVDFLNNEPIAKTIVSLLQERPHQPITVGVHGDWGAGKSSVLEMVEELLDRNDKVVCLKFNGWRFQGFEDAKVALMEGVVEALLKKRPILTRATASVKEVYHRIDKMKVAKRGIGLLGAGAAFVMGHHELGMMALASGLGSVLAKPETYSKDKLAEVVDGAKELLNEKKDHPSNVAEDITAFRKAFDQMLNDAQIDQLVVLIDDLDRCLPKTAIETLEAVRLFMFTAKTAFVVAADEAMIEYSVREHFPDLPDTTGPQSYARAYLEKLIQVPFRIPALGQTETRIYVTLLLIGAELGDDDPAFTALLAEAKLHLTRPWLGGTLNAASVKKAVGNDKAKEDQTHNALLISEQIGPLLAAGTRGNPRQVKRFLNTLLLRQESARARGFVEDVKLPVLAKLMLAERFNPRVFDQIATVAASAPDGVCLELAVLEEAVRVEPQEKPSIQGLEDVVPAKKSQRTSQGKAERDRAETQTAIAKEWLASDSAKEWAKLRPSMAGVDLRPYLFVAKDRKDYFGAVTQFGQVAAIAEKLLGAKISVQREGEGLRLLAAPEASQVFDALRGLIVATDDFKSKPKGIDGMDVLVRAQPHLQTNLLDFLGSLPPERLGTWACVGWDSALKEGQIKVGLYPRGNVLGR